MGWEAGRGRGWGRDPDREKGEVVQEGIVLVTDIGRNGGRQSNLLLGKMALVFNIGTEFCPLCSTHILPPVTRFIWLLVFLQVEFKVLLITFKALHNTDYLQGLPLCKNSCLFQ